MAEQMGCEPGFLPHYEYSSTKQPNPAAVSHRHPLPPKLCLHLLPPSKTYTETFLRMKIKTVVEGEIQVTSPFQKARGKRESKKRRWGITGGKTNIHSPFSLWERLLRNSSPPFASRFQGTEKDAWLYLTASEIT